MVSPTIPKLPKLPWPALVGVSLILHAGALSLGLPLMVRVDTPPSSSIDIPVTLVGGDAELAATPENPPPLAAQIPKTSIQPPTPIGGETATATPTVNSQTFTQSTLQQEVAPEQSPNPEISDQPADGDTTRETPRATAPENLPASDSPAADEEAGQTSDTTAGEGSIAISIVGVSTVPSDTPGDWPDVLPTLQNTSTLSIANHTCNDALPAGEVTLGLEIAADGSVVQTFVPPDQNTLPAQVASCLLNHALSVDPSALRFTPASTGQSAIATDRMQLIIQFSAS
ncbi:MAG: hypothetical protein AAGF93_22985 [Cyanobacteria bacterium P01_H01_bin.105]